MQIRIGIADAGREVEIDVDDAQALIADVEAAMSAGDGAMLWLTDIKGRRFGVPARRVAFIEIEADERSAVGFGPA